MVYTAAQTLSTELPRHGLSEKRGGNEDLRVNQDSHSAFSSRRDCVIDSYRLHADLNVLPAESRSVFENLVHAVRAKLGLIVLFIDLPDRTLRKRCKVLLTGVLYTSFFCTLPFSSGSANAQVHGMTIDLCDYLSIIDIEMCDSIAVHHIDLCLFLRKHLVEKCGGSLCYIERSSRLLRTI